VQGSIARPGPERYVASRNLEIDTLRGLACILLVLFHVIGYSPQDGLQVDDGMLRDVNDALAYLRMPLFTFLSGFVYAYRPFQEGMAQFLQGKARRLLIPLLVVGALFMLVRALAPQANDAADQGPLMFFLAPANHFWFLEALFLVFLVIVPLEALGVLKRERGLLLTLALFASFFLLNIETDWLSLGGAFFLMPFFLLGLWLCRFEPEQRIGVNRYWLALWGGVAVTVLMLQLPEHKHSLHALVLSLLFCLSLYMARPRSRWLAVVGLYSYSIYLFHVFFTAGARIGLYQTGITSIWVHVALGLAAGLAFPAVVEMVAARSRYLRTLFLGKRFQAATPQRQFSRPV
jgi:peptidoglycan/LPS O-acetylase OafA/YrhL